MIADDKAGVVLLLDRTGRREAAGGHRGREYHASAALTLRRAPQGSPLVRLCGRGGPPKSYFAQQDFRSYQVSGLRNDNLPERFGHKPGLILVDVVAAVFGDQEACIRTSVARFSLASRKTDSSASDEKPSELLRQVERTRVGEDCQRHRAKRRGRSPHLQTGRRSPSR